MIRQAIRRVLPALMLVSFPAGAGAQAPAPTPVPPPGPDAVSVAGIQYVVLKSGPPSGEHPTRADAVQIDFEGKTMDGRVFDASSRYPNRTAIFPLRLLIPGWVVAVQLMKRGDRWRIYIPPELAYGRTGTNRLAGQTLVFEIELIDFAPMPPQPPPMLDALPQKPVPATQRNPAPVPYGETFVARHMVSCGGTRLPLVATMKSTIVVDSAGVPAVNFVSFSYVRDDVRDRTNRPVIFAFGGGPTGAAMGYHMFLLGPKVIRHPAQEPGATFSETMRDNADCLFDIADAVMIDPAESGFSRILPGGKKAYYFSVAGDLASIGQFIHTWMKENGREASPLYVLGGSYGSVRTIRLAWDLRNSAKPVDGIIMTGNSTMIQELQGALNAATTLPSMTMTALYHGKIDRRGRSDSTIMAEAYSWAMTEYLGALNTFNDMTPAERMSWANQLAARTGISAALFLANDLAISRQLFSRELLKDRGLVLNNPNDARFTAPAPPPREPGQPNPGSGSGQDGGGGSRPATSPHFAAYLKDYLGVTYPMSEYWETTPGTDWDYSGPPEARTAIGRNDWAKMLRETMELHPRLRVYSANGYQDMLTTAGQARLLFSRTRLPRDRIVIREYDGGHAVQRYLPTSALIARDIRKFLTGNKP